MSRCKYSGHCDVADSQIRGSLSYWPRDRALHPLCADQAQAESACRVYRSLGDNPANRKSLERTTHPNVSITIGVGGVGFGAYYIMSGASTKNLF